MLRVVLVLLVTISGLAVNFFEPFYGLLLYTWYSFAYPLELTYGMLEGSRLSFIVALSFILATLLHHRRLFFNSALTYIVILFIIHVFASQALQGKYQFASILRDTDYLNKAAIISLICPVVITTATRFRHYLGAIAIIIGLLAFYYGVFGLVAGSRSIGGVGKIGDNNFYSVMLVTVIPLYIGYLFSFKQRSIKLGLWFGLGGIIVAIILTFSRGGLVGLLAVVILLILNIKKRLLVPFVLFLSIICFYLSQNNYAPSIERYSFERDFRQRSSVVETFDLYRARISTLFINPTETESGKSRMHFWKVAWEMAKDKPLYGVGIKKFRDNYDQYDFLDGEYGSSRSVHSLYFMLLAETGLVGLLLFLAIIVVSIYYFISSVRRLNSLELATEESKSLSKLISYLPIALVGFMMSSMFVTTLYMEIFWSLVTLAIASRQLSKQMTEQMIELAMGQNESTTD